MIWLVLCIWDRFWEMLVLKLCLNMLLELSSWRLSWLGDSSSSVRLNSSYCIICYNTIMLYI